MQHSTLIGGSIASRRLNCPGSYQEQLRAPPGTTSAYAEEGTKRHDQMAYWLEHPKVKLQSLPNVTTEDIAALEIAEQALYELEQYHGGNFEILEQDWQVEFPGVPGAFGTLDIIEASPTHIIVADFKFGAGVQVSAENDDGTPNDQLMFYTCGVPKKWIGKRAIVLAIIQPTFEPAYTFTIVTPEQLKAFEARIKRAVIAALGHNPKRVRGEWCRFAPCKATCALWTGPLLDLTAIGKPTQTAHPDIKAWGEYLANAKRLVDSAIMYKGAIDAALLEHLKNGHSAPGFALKPNRTTRKWLEDVKHVAKVLTKLGLKEHEIWQHKIQTFQVVDAAAKKRGVEIPDSLRPKPESTELVLTSEDDPQKVNVQEQASLFRERMKALVK